MVVDDEPLVRIALRTMLPWEDHEFRCDLEARNGEQALALLRANPDVAVIFLDMVMPVMDGLEFIRRVKLAGNCPEIVVLSAHDDFSLVREAFKAGIRDYILKADLDPARVLEVARTAVSRIEEQQADETRRANLVRRDAALLKQEILKRLVTGAAIEDFHSQRELLGIRLGGRLRLAILWVDDYESVRFRYAGDTIETFSAAFLNAVDQVLSRYRYGEAVQTASDEFCVLLGFDDAPFDQIDRVTTEILDEVKRNLSHFLNVQTSSYVSVTGDEPDSISALYESARRFRSSASRLVVKARRYIQDNYADADLSLSDVAESLQVSTNHLSYQFAREAGKTFKEYLMETRLEAAKKLLMSTPLKVYEVSRQVGYRNVEHFCRIFRRVTGNTPGSFSTER